MNEKNLEDSSEESSEDEESKWDCQSILTTHTNTDNHPGVIKSEKRVVKTNSKNKFELHKQLKVPIEGLTDSSNPAVAEVTTTNNNNQLSAKSKK